MSASSSNGQHAANLQPLTGYHHMTMVASDARENVRFYTETLRLRLVKKTVNFDMTSTYHLYYGDYAGSSGSLLTFFEWPNAERGRPGWGGTHHMALSVQSGAALAYWRGHLEREGVEVEGPFDDHGFPTVRFHDPDGVVLELSAPTGEDVPDGAPAIWSTTMAIGSLHHVMIQATSDDTAMVYYRDLLGFDLLGESANLDNPDQTDLIFGVDTGSGTSAAMRLIVTIVDRTKVEQAKEGVGQTHHIAFGVVNDPVELAWHERIASAGIPVSDVRDRSYFHSIYFNDPDGHLLEIATANPGFATDEPLDSLGQRLSLPPWLESRREQIESTLVPIG